MASLSPPLAFFSMATMRFSRLSRSASISSVSMVSISASGAILPSTWVMSPSSKQRTTWAMASHSRILARNWLPRPSPCEAPRTRPAMSTKVRRVGTICAELAISRQRVEARIRHRHLADIRLDGAERIIRRLRRRGLRQRVEEGRLADVRQADDAAFEAHDCSTAVRIAVGSVRNGLSDADRRHWSDRAGDPRSGNAAAARRAQTPHLHTPRQSFRPPAPTSRAPRARGLATWYPCPRLASPGATVPPPRSPAVARRKHTSFRHSQARRVTAAFRSRRAERERSGEELLDRLELRPPPDAPPTNSARSGCSSPPQRRARKVSS